MMTDEAIYQKLEYLLTAASYGELVNHLGHVHQFMKTQTRTAAPNRLALLRLQQSLALRVVTLATEQVEQFKRENRDDGSEVPELRRPDPLGEDGGRQGHAAEPGPG